METNVIITQAASFLLIGCGVGGGGGVGRAGLFSLWLLKHTVAYTSIRLVPGEPVLFPECE